MFNSVRKYVFENLFPSYNDYFNYRNNNGAYGQHQLLRKGIVCATSLYHLREHITLPNPITRSAWEHLCADYALLGDVVNVSKHKHITNHTPQISDSKQLDECIYSVIFEDEKGEYYFNWMEVLVSLNNGQTKELSGVLYNVMNMVLDELKNLGIMETNNPQNWPWDMPISRGFAKTKSIPIEIIRGEDYQFMFKVFKYNYQSCELELDDCLDSKLIFTVRELPKSIPIDINMPAKNICIPFDVPLTEEQRVIYFEMEHDEERQDYCNKLIADSPEIQNSINTCIREFRNKEEK
ncbi:MAG TPA: hypothetical protein VFC89_01175 [Oscillospiraceae bacterium]|nr:hypothetical protein [Oscillospiraceae bacterium]